MATTLKPVYFPNQKYGVNMRFPGSDKEINLEVSFGCIISERPKFIPPEVKTEYVDILGADGRLDLTGAVDGKVYFGNWKLEIHVIANPETVHSYGADVYMMMCIELLGRKCSVLVQRYDERDGVLPVIADDYFPGRIISIENDHDGHFDNITITFEMDTGERSPFGSREQEVYEWYNMPIIHEGYREGD